MASKILLRNIQQLTVIVAILTILIQRAVSEGEIIVDDGDKEYMGVIVSPNYPDLYPNSILKGWNIRSTQREYSVKLVFDFFEVESHTECNFDKVTVYQDSWREDLALVGQFCDNEIPEPITTWGNKTLIVFQTDSSQQRKGFKIRYKSEIYLKEIIRTETEINLVEYFLNTKRQYARSLNKWGTEISRTAVALFLYDPQFFAAGNETGEKISYELSLQLMAKLVLKKIISTKDLALFVNAMTVACIDPKNFFGVNIVRELRNRIDISDDINPFFYLALCNAGDNMKMEDVHKLQQLFNADLRDPWKDTQAMVVMALKCISMKSQINLNDSLTEMVSQLKTKQQTDGKHVNLRITALVVQALVATDDYRSNFSMSRAMKSIFWGLNHKSLDVEDHYYMLPIIKLKTLLDINSYHCENTVKTNLEDIDIDSTRKNSEKRIQVQFSIIIGDDMDFSRTWRIHVPLNYSFYQVLENISFTEPDFVVQYCILDRKHYVDGIASFKDSTEDGSFWFTFTKPLSSTNNPVLITDSLEDILMDENNELILWYRSKSRFNNTPEIFSDNTDELDISSGMAEDLDISSDITNIANTF